MNAQAFCKKADNGVSRIFGVPLVVLAAHLWPANTGSGIPCVVTARSGRFSGTGGEWRSILVERFELEGVASRRTDAGDHYDRRLAHGGGCRRPTIMRSSLTAVAVRRA